MFESQLKIIPNAISRGFTQSVQVHASISPP